jgi:EmrB/QacA subfamily drug resistance transporter
LIAIAFAQLMIVLDGTIVTIALPTMQRDLGFTQANLQWVINAYTLAFGGLLLLGGRIADLIGRKRAMLVALACFSLVSGIGGLAQEQTWLVLARGAQGICAAVLAPAALSLLSVTFAAGHERARAFAVFGSIGTAGAVVGLLLGGIFTSYLSWRWTLWVNVPVGLLTALLTAWCLPSDPRARKRRARLRHLDLPGALLVTVGVVALVYAFVHTTTEGWVAPITMLLLGSAGLLLAAFIVRETRAAEPLLPMRVVLDRTRGGAFLASLFAGAGVLGMFYFMSQYLQNVHHYSAIVTGLAFLPNTAAVLLGASLAQRFLPRVGPRTIGAAGSLASAVGAAGLALLGTTSSFVGHVLPASLILCLGLGLTTVTLAATALHGVPHEDAGVASAVFTAAQQVGGACGLAIFATVAASITGSRQTAAAVTRGYDAGFIVAAGFFVLAAAIIAVLVRSGRDEAEHEDAPVLTLI